MIEFANRIEFISDDYKSLKEIVLKYSTFGITKEEGNYKIYNQPWIAPLKYAIYIFDRTPLDYFNMFKVKKQLEIPAAYERYLGEMNGCFIFGFRLYGLTPSIYEKGVIDRSKMQCYDLGNANQDWKNEYNVDKSLLHFGGRTYSYEENIGYFMDLSGNIKSIRKNGEILNSWNDFSTFLSDEIKLAELYEKNKENEY